MTTEGDPPSPVGFSPLAGTLVTLRPILPRDYEFVFQAEVGGEAARRWRLKGTTPSYEVWLDGFWRGVLAQFLMVSNDTKQALGFVTAYNANMRDRHAHLALISFRPGQDSLLIIHGATLFVSYLFETWEFRKLYAEVSGYNLPEFGSSLGLIAAEEGRLRDHEYAAGRWWDQHLLAIYRSTWEEWRELALDSVGSGVKYRQEYSSVDDIRPTRDWPRP